MRIFPHERNARPDETIGAGGSTHSRASRASIDVPAPPVSDSEPGPTPRRRLAWRPLRWTSRRFYEYERSVPSMRSSWHVAIRPPRAGFHLTSRCAVRTRAPRGRLYFPQPETRARSTTLLQSSRLLPVRPAPRAQLTGNPRQLYLPSAVLLPEPELKRPSLLPWPLGSRNG